MAKIEITVPGERIVEEFTALVAQPTSPSTAKAPDVGLVEISQVQPTELVPGPPGPPGPRGSRWFFGDGAPVSPGVVLGDVYLDDATGKIWVWNGTAWVDTGTDLSPDAAELLAKLLTVDGTGSLLDADTLDGHDSTYFATDSDMTAIEGRMTTNEAKDVSQDANLATINADQVTQNNRLTSIEGVNTTQDANIALKANIASPTFTGDPKAPTPATADNDTSVATTAYVKANLATVSQFPEAPLDGLTYGRRSAAWATIVGGAVVADSPPGAPLQNGQLWFKSNSGDTFIYVDDGNSQQWVQQNVMPTTGSTPVATAETRNRLINPALQISQEQGYGASGPSTAQSSYSADQWLSTTSTAPGTTTSQRVVAVTPKGSRDRMRWTVGTAKTSLGANDIVQWHQPLEGLRTADFQWGTANAKQIVLRFGWKSPAGTYSVYFNALSSRVYFTQWTISAGQANTDTEQVLVIPGDVTGAWPTDNTRGLGIGFILASGSINFGTPNVWGTAGLATAANFNFLSSTSNVIEIFDIGLYMDPLLTGKAPAWTLPDHASELAACQRYWAQTGGLWSGNATSGLNYYASYVSPVVMRTVPAYSGVNVVANGFPASIGIFENRGFFVNEYRNANATANGSFFMSQVTMNARV